MGTALPVQQRNFIRKSFAAAAAVLAACAVFSFCTTAGAREDVNIAAGDGVKVYVSSAPNPAWPAQQVNDGLLDTTHGWVSSADQGAPAWVMFEFESPRRVSSIVLYQAGLTEGGKDRFARPKSVKVTMEGAAPVTAELRDAEREPQKILLPQTDTTFVKIDILSTWPDAKFPFLTGFQEAEVYSGEIIAGSSAVDAPPMLPDDAPPLVAVKQPEKITGGPTAADISDAAAAVEASVEGTLGRDGLDDEERALIELLKEFTAKLEDYLKRKNTAQK